MPTNKSQLDPSQSRSRLNQEVKKSQGWEEPEDRLLVMRLVGKED